MVPVVNTLIFDLDDTLVVEEASAEAAFVQTGALARLRYDLDPHLLHTAVRQACRELWYAFPSYPYCKRVGISSWEGMWAEFTGPDPELKALRDWAPTYRRESWRQALLRNKIDDPGLAAQLAETFPGIRRAKQIVYPDSIPTLQQLRGNYVLGLLTNGTPDLQWTKITGAGISGYFEQVLVAGEVGIAKPDPHFYWTFLARLKAEPETTLMIGNSLTLDVQGSQAAGLRAVWVNRSGQACDEAIVPDWEIAGLGELEPILASLSA
jgi:putative hydrolase of the HAD superfamily